MLSLIGVRKTIKELNPVGRGTLEFENEEIGLRGHMSENTSFFANVCTSIL